MSLGLIGDTRAVDPLIKALEDEVWEVRSGAAYALGDIGDPIAEEPLKHVASNDKVKEVRYEAEKALRKLKYYG